ncbi:MAG: sugar phosphate isomerase/epimerase family protein [Planctomycetia bacterium]|nr:sugar phosphate isomerase/epimerase family protein [Planctomycetia bacterium]
MMIKIGINALLWTDSIGEATIPLFAKVRELGFDLIELPIYTLSEKTAKALAAELDANGLLRTSCTTCSEEENLLSDDPRIRQQGIDALKYRLDRAAILGCTTLLGPLCSPLGSFTGSGPSDLEFGRAVESMRIAAEHAASVQVKFAIEAVNRFESYFINCMEQGLRFVKAVDHPYCKLMFDTFHAHIEEKSVQDAIRSAAAELIHVHISENDRSTPGAGQVNWKTAFDTLAEIKYNGPMVIEAFGSSLPNLAAATRIWRKMYTTEEDLASSGLQFIRQEWTRANS